MTPPSPTTLASVLEQFPAAAASERSEAIRQLVACAMEGPLDLSELQPMPVASGPVLSEVFLSEPADSRAAAPLSPLPTTAAPFQAVTPTRPELS